MKGSPGQVEKKCSGRQLRKLGVSVSSNSARISIRCQRVAKIENDERDETDTRFSFT